MTTMYHNETFRCRNCAMAPAKGLLSAFFGGFALFRGSNPFGMRIFAVRLCLQRSRKERQLACNFEILLPQGLVGTALCQLKVLAGLP